MLYERDRQRVAAGAPAQIEIKGVTKRYGPLLALNDVHLTINRGELFSLVGSSGCGKTTLLRSMAGFVHPDSGQIVIGGRDMAGLAPYDRPVNMMFQSYALFPHMTVEDNIAFGLRREGLKSAEIKQRVGEALDLIEMGSLGRRRPHQLSGGQRQRVALARAVVKRPQVLLLDEPLSALDKKLRENTQFELVNIQEQLGITFVMVTHDQEEAMTMSTRIAVMSEGRIVQIGSPSQIYERPANRFVADFVGTVNLFEGTICASGDGLATVKCDAIPALLQVPNDSLPVGTTAAIAVRPERIRIEPATAQLQAQNQFDGKVMGIAFVGDRRLYHIAVAGGTTVKVTQVNAAADGASLLSRGDAVRIGWEPAAGFLVQS